MRILNQSTSIPIKKQTPVGLSGSEGPVFQSNKVGPVMKPSDILSPIGGQSLPDSLNEKIEQYLYIHDL